MELLVSERLTRLELRVLALVMSQAGKRGARLSTRQIASALGLSRTSVQRALSSLVGGHILESTQEGKKTTLWTHPGVHSGGWTHTGVQGGHPTESTPPHTPPKEVISNTPPVGPPPEKTPRGSRLKFEDLPLAWHTWADLYAEDAGKDFDCHLCWEQFRDYWMSKPGQGGVKLDWQRTWQTWVRKELNGGPGKPKASAKPNPPAEDAPQREWRAFCDAWGLTMGHKSYYDLRQEAWAKYKTGGRANAELERRANGAGHQATGATSSGVRVQAHGGAVQRGGRGVSRGA